MRAFSLLVLISGAVLCGGCKSSSTAPTGSEPKASEPPKKPVGDMKDYEQLKGTWQVIAIEAAGKAVPADRVQAIRLQYIFDGDKVTIHRPDRPDNTPTFTIDGTTNPKRLTINRTPSTRAVYAVEGNKLRLCLMVDENPNAGYPTELASKASPKTDLLTLERR